MLPPNDTHDAQARVLLRSGVILGLVLTAVGLLHSGEPRPDASSDAMPTGSVARVNGYPIATAIYARILGGVAAERKTAAVERADRQRILDRLIDEELLVQRGVELGLAHTDRILRRQIVTALTASLTTEATEIMPDEGELRRFYSEHSELFARTDRLSVAQIFLRVPSASQDVDVYQRAEQAAQRLRTGESFEAVNAELGNEPILRLPAGLLPPEKIQEYLGPTVTQTLLTLPPGQISDPIRSGTGYHVLILQDRQLGVAPPFETIRETVLAQYRRATGEKAVIAYIADLRTRAQIETAKEWETVEEEKVLRGED